MSSRRPEGAGAGEVARAAVNQPAGEVPIRMHSHAVERLYAAARLNESPSSLTGDETHGNFRSGRIRPELAREFTDAPDMGSRLAEPGTAIGFPPRRRLRPDRFPFSSILRCCNNGQHGFDRFLPGYQRWRTQGFSSERARQRTGHLRCRVTWARHAVRSHTWVARKVPFPIAPEAAV